MTSTLKSTRELQSKQNKPSGGRSHASSSRAFSSPRASGESEPGNLMSLGEWKASRSKLVSFS
eukprot:CAMPEP_0183568000 /NCGR_PEP_ID=MMETSP0371-20130417/115950_1 /TAXON_ID=268820 /ORGANISM="Peridinium aciculiferum, Strain PAER-2" /LENGTH=62 /DNA_ID=CAMNT_0025777441 /DNA_START=58 /DNA_END=243 /DNA_ORIENTATION=-